MLRTELLKKQSKTPASTNKITRENRSTANSLASVLCTPKRITRSFSKTVLNHLGVDEPLNKSEKRKIATFVGPLNFETSDDEIMSDPEINRSGRKSMKKPDKTPKSIKKNARKSLRTQIGESLLTAKSLFDESAPSDFGCVSTPESDFEQNMLPLVTGYAVKNGKGAMEAKTPKSVKKVSRKSIRTPRTLHGASNDVDGSSVSESDGGEKKTFDHIAENNDIVDDTMEGIGTISVVDTTKTQTDETVEDSQQTILEEILNLTLENVNTMIENEQTQKGTGSDSGLETNSDDLNVPNEMIAVSSVVDEPKSSKVALKRPITGNSAGGSCGAKSKIVSSKTGPNRKTISFGDFISTQTVEAPKGRKSMHAKVLMSTDKRKSMIKRYPASMNLATGLDIDSVDDGSAKEIVSNDLTNESEIPSPSPSKVKLMRQNAVIVNDYQSELEYLEDEMAFNIEKINTIHIDENKEPILNRENLVIDSIQSPVQDRESFEADLPSVRMIRSDTYEEEITDDLPSVSMLVVQTTNGVDSNESDRNSSMIEVSNGQINSIDDLESSIVNRKSMVNDGTQSTIQDRHSFGTDTVLPSNNMLEKDTDAVTNETEISADLPSVEMLTTEYVNQNASENKSAMQSEASNNQNIEASVSFFNFAKKQQLLVNRLSIIDLTESPIPKKDGLNKTFSPKPERKTFSPEPEIIEINDETFTEEVADEKVASPINNKTFSPKPAEIETVKKDLSQRAGPSGVGGVKNKLPNEKVIGKVVFKFGASTQKLPTSNTFNFKLSTKSKSPLPVFKKFEPAPKVVVKPKPLAVVKPRANVPAIVRNTTNRSQLNSEQREQRRMQMYQNTRAPKRNSMEKNGYEIKGVRMNRRMQLLYEKRANLKD